MICLLYGPSFRIDCSQPFYISTQKNAKETASELRTSAKHEGVGQGQVSRLPFCAGVQFSSNSSPKKKKKREDIGCEQSTGCQ